MISFNENKYRARASVSPNNRIIASEHGVRQVIFPYKLFRLSDYLNLLWGKINRIEDSSNLLATRGRLRQNPSIYL